MENYGLSDEQARLSRQEHGGNTLTERPAQTFWDKLRGNFSDPMIRILCVALGINILFAFLGKTEWYESAGIAAAVLLATLISTFSEYKNENAFRKLQEDASRVSCKVWRNGELGPLPIDELVVGDCALLQTGDRVPADGVLLEGTVRVDQSALNGESKEAAKCVMPADAVEQDGEGFLSPYRLYRGSVVCGGSAVLRVDAVGDATVYGGIAGELQTDDGRDTPLKLKLRHLARGISRFGYIGGAAIALAFLLQRAVLHNGFDPARIAAYFNDWMGVANDALQAVMLAVIIIVMAVPEGLPLMIAIVSAQNMGKMLKDNVLVRRIAGIETAGSLNILFTDKTGTITKGQLEAVAFVDGRGKTYQNYADVVGELGRLLSVSIRGNTEAVLTGTGEKRRVIGGNATERAVLGFAAGRTGELKVATVANIPFNSTDKFSAAQVTGDYALSLIKGAPEKILSRCAYCYDENGNRMPFAANGALAQVIDRMAARAIRVLALATSDAPIADGQPPAGNWTLVGVLGIRDEVRPESAASVAQVRAAGVQVVMITGDRRDTAAAIAAEAGLLGQPGDLIYTSDELAGMSDETLKARLKNIRVVARALPADKSRLVRLAQEMGLVAGMTGDGVNDAPALNRADVGFAMGGGTEVAKEAGDIVVLDDNFRSIDRAILYGRTIYNTIRKFIVFQLTINVAAVLISFLSPLLGLDNPLSITQILWVNLVMDTLAALAFGGEPALARYLHERPKRRDEAIVSPGMWGAILTGSLWTCAVSMAFLYAPFMRGLFRADPADIYLLTGFFCYFIFTAVFNAFNARTARLNLFDNLRGNLGFLRVMLVIALVQVGMAYLGGEIFRGHGLTGSEWLAVLLAAFTIVPVDLLRKAVAGRIRRKKSAARQTAAHGRHADSY